MWFGLLIGVAGCLLWWGWLLVGCALGCLMVVCIDAIGFGCRLSSGWFCLI